MNQFIKTSVVSPEWSYVMSYRSKNAFMEPCEMHVERSVKANDAAQAFHLACLQEGVRIADVTYWAIAIVN